MRTWKSNSTEETILIAEKIAQDVRVPAVVALTGELGAGKTQFAKGFALGLGVANAVNSLISPTFNLMQSYQGEIFSLYHWDWYRLNSYNDIVELGYFEQKNMSIYLIEWADRFPDIFDEDTVWIDISYSEQSNERNLVCRVGSYNEG